MRTPFENYVKTLIAGRKSLDSILMDLRSMELKMNEKDLFILKDQLYLEQPEYFENFNEPVDIDWLEHHNIDKMFGFLFDKQIRRDINGIEGALKIFEDPQIYKIVTALSLAGFDVNTIEVIIQGRIDISYEFEDFKEFINYFFNVEGWSKKDKEFYTSTVINPELKKIYVEALKGDNNKLLWKLKLNPNLEFEEMLRQISYDSFYKFKNTLEINPDIALKFASMVEKIAGRLEKLTEERKSDLGSQGNFNLLFEEDEKTEIKTFSQLKKEEGD